MSAVNDADRYEAHREPFLPTNHVRERQMTAMARDWRSRAACRDVDPEVFFPTAEEGPVYESQVATAKAVCGRCPVRMECVADARAGMPYGIAGGLTPDERRHTARGRRPDRGVDAVAQAVAALGAGAAMLTDDRAERAGVV